VSSGTRLIQGVVWNMLETHVPHNTLNFCAAKPREPPVSEGEAAEHQTCSYYILVEITRILV